MDGSAQQCQRRIVALLTPDAVLALDIKEALASVGFDVWVVDTDFGAPVPDRIDAAIVDSDAQISLPSEISDRLVDVPTIMINELDHAHINGMTCENLIAQVAKPFHADLIVPLLIASTIPASA